MVQLLFKRTFIVFFIHFFWAKVKNNLSICRIRANLICITFKAFNGLGECVKVTNTNLTMLENDYDLNVPVLKGLCNKTVDESCCSCMKKKTCKDNGCSSRFGGEGNT